MIHWFLLTLLIAIGDLIYQNTYASSVKLKLELPKEGRLQHLFICPCVKAYDIIAKETKLAY